jgi:hypothetical protein
MTADKKQKTFFGVLGYICVCLVVINTLFLFLMGLYDTLICIPWITSLLLLFMAPLYLLGIIIKMVFWFEVTRKNIGTTGIFVFIFMCIIAILFFSVPGGLMSYPVTNLGMKLNVKMNGGYENLHLWAQEVMEKHKNVEIDGAYEVKGDFSQEIKNIVDHATVFIRDDIEQPGKLFLDISYGSNRPGDWGIIIEKTKPENSLYYDEYYFQWNSHIYSYFDSNF